MFINGTIVTLRDRKTYDDGGDDVTLESGLCGMVVKFNGDNTYVIDFGAYGQINATEDELSGESIEDKGKPEKGEKEEAKPKRKLSSDDDEPFVVVDVEADMKARVAQLEKGID